MKKTNTTAIVVTIAVLAVILAVFALQWQAAHHGDSGLGARSAESGPLIDASDRSLVARGEQVYAVQCAACHGARLEGQPNWRTRLPNGRLPAPPHDETGHTWHHSDALLFDLVKNGLVAGRTAPAGYESDMPAYASMLSDEDIIAVLAYIKSTWPREVAQAQARMNH